MLIPLYKELNKYREHYNAQSVQDTSRFIYLSKIHQDGHCVAVHLKCLHTGKKLRFIYEPEKYPGRLFIQRLEKTRDLVQHIDHIHQVLDESIVSYTGVDCPSIVESLWQWAMTVSEGRTFPMERPSALPYPTDHQLKDQQLYYGLITGFNVDTLDPTSAVVTLSFLNKSVVTVQCHRHTALNLCPSLIWVGNNQGHYRIARLSSIRSHVLFSRDEYNAIKHWIYGQLDPIPPHSLLYTVY
jgi:hypothetical protein